MGIHSPSALDSQVGDSLFQLHFHEMQLRLPLSEVGHFLLLFYLWLLGDTAMMDHLRGGVQTGPLVCCLCVGKLLEVSISLG